MNGLLSLYSSKFLDVGYNDDGNDDGNEDDISFYNPESDDGGSYHPFPKLMLGNLGTTSFEDIKKVAKNTRQDFVILVLSEDEYSWKERFSWWWFQKVPRIPNQEYLATENSDPPYFLAVSQLDGQYLEVILQEKKRMVLDYGELRDPSIQIEIDDSSSIRGIDLSLQILFYIVFICIACKWLFASDSFMDEDFKNNKKPKFTATDLGQGEIRESSTSHECAICLETMPVGTTVRILPCRHSFHHECIIGWLDECKYSCPMCKFDLFDHFEEQKEAKEIIHPKESLKRILWKRLRRKIETGDDQLLDGADVGGDLELTVEQQVDQISAEDGVTV